MILSATFVHALFLKSPVMNKNILILFLLIKSSFCFSQMEKTCSCDGLVDIGYKNAIAIFDKPLGQIKHRIKQDFKNENLLAFTIDKDSSDFFHLTMSYSRTDKAYTGWVKKAAYLGTYSRVYNDTLNLYSKPDLRSRIKSRIPTYTNSLLPITACRNKWVYVKIKKSVEGWLQEKDQCANPYTTCD